MQRQILARTLGISCLCLAGACGGADSSADTGESTTSAASTPTASSTTKTQQTSGTGGTGTSVSVSTRTAQAGSRSSSMASGGATNTQSSGAQAGSSSAPPTGSNNSSAGSTTASGGSGGLGTSDTKPGAMAAAGAGGSDTATAEHFSFFVTSYAAIQRLSGSPDGFGGDLRYGASDGLAGADKICTEIAEASLPGAGAKVWRAFLSVTKGQDGNPVHAIDRVGQGPWYDRLGRIVAMTREDLVNTRPKGADASIANDLPNEDGVPNHAPDGMMQVDNHDILTGTNDKGQLYNADWSYTCHDWTSANGPDGTPRVGHSWPRSGGGGGRRPGNGAAGSSAGGMMGGVDTANWMSALNEAGCAPGASLVEMGPPDPDVPTVGSGGGYGGIYCFALKP